MKVVLSTEARRDLEEIGDYIAQNSPNRARTFVRELVAAAQKIGEAPTLFSVLPGYETYDFRRKLYGNYIIFYVLERDRVNVLHVLHGARDYAALLLPDEEEN